MKLSEKLAKESAPPRARCVGASFHLTQLHHKEIDMYEKGFMDGFIKAREMAAKVSQEHCEWDAMSCMCDERSKAISGMGEDQNG